MKSFLPALAALAIISFFQTALAAPALEATSLYKTMTHGRRTLEQSQWPEAVKRVFRKADAELKKIELCNEGAYSIFTVVFKYDPNGPNDHYYNRIFVDLAAANNYRSYAVVDPSWGQVVEASVKGKNKISIEREEFDAPAGQ
ncbi:hypothetical protein [Methylocystis parvus]|uniref:Cystatin domain-containing protein n=1 Tax=Methylocystis parvus TaxID=134 RepID=A0A6B8M930_9HYPH|nr:hypothetical protein [Methylocystis parvus]QGM99078.1 hypothetical protein F7D14_17360 [Methylocystis parvus]WBK00554.1 hypothetical protein MMG94_02180 [Methylocystis parvus OBBP]